MQVTICSQQVPSLDGYLKEIQYSLKFGNYLLDKRAYFLNCLKKLKIIRLDSKNLSSKRPELI